MRVLALLRTLWYIGAIAGELLQQFDAAEPSIFNGPLNLTNELPKGVVQAADPPPQPPTGPTPGVPDLASSWYKAWCRGSKLHLGMTYSADQAAKFVTPLTSPWNGAMREELRTWGYKDDSNADGVDGDCQFETKHSLKTAFDALGIDSQSQGQGGSNVCYRYTHFDGPTVIRSPNNELPPKQAQYYTVNNRQYRVS